MGESGTANTETESDSDDDGTALVAGEFRLTEFD